VALREFLEAKSNKGRTEKRNRHLEAAA